MTRQLISIICPIYNEELSIRMFYDRTKKFMDSLADQYDFELIFTNNRSTDGSYMMITELRAADPRVKLLTFSRNFGYQASVLAGLTYATGDASVVIDVDCEDPPELIPEFLTKWNEGYQVVYGIRNKRQEPEVLQAVRRFFYWLLQKLGDSEVVMNMAEFALIDQVVRKVILNNKSTFPFLRTEIGYAGFRRIGIDYVRQARKYGKTHYHLWGMSAFAIGGILSSSTFLLRLPAFIGMVLIPLNILLLLLSLMGLYANAFEILVGLDLMFLVFFTSVLSIYNARIYKDGVQRPIFIVDWNHSFLE